MAVRYMADILGEKFPLKSEDGTVEELKAIADMVSDRTASISEAIRSRDVTKISILTALQIAGDYLKLKKDYDELVELLEEDK